MRSSLRGLSTHPSSPPVKEERTLRTLWRAAGMTLRARLRRVDQLVSPWWAHSRLLCSQGGEKTPARACSPWSELSLPWGVFFIILTPHFGPARDQGDFLLHRMGIFNSGTHMDQRRDQIIGQMRSGVKIAHSPILK
jgi:hypothetical protein